MAVSFRPCTEWKGCSRVSCPATTSTKSVSLNVRTYRPYSLKSWHFLFFFASATPAVVPTSHPDRNATVREEGWRALCAKEIVTPRLQLTVVPHCVWKGRRNSLLVKFDCSSLSVKTQRHSHTSHTHTHTHCPINILICMCTPLSSRCRCCI